MFEIVGDLLDECFLAVGQLELVLDGLIVGQHHQVAAGAAEAGATEAPSAGTTTLTAPAAPAAATTARLLLSARSESQSCKRNNQPRHDKSDSDARHRVAPRYGGQMD